VIQRLEWQVASLPLSFVPHQVSPMITLIQKNRIYIGDKVIPIGESYTDNFYRLLPNIK